MKLELDDEPKKVEIELDLDEGNLLKGNDNCSGLGVAKSVIQRSHKTLDNKLCLVCYCLYS